DTRGQEPLRGDDRSRDFEPLILFHHSNPVVSGNPQRMFMLCTAWPLAPFTMLSSALITTKRPVRGSTRQAISSVLVPTTVLVSGKAWPCSRRTKGSSP